MKNIKELQAALDRGERVEVKLSELGLSLEDARSLGRLVGPAIMCRLATRLNKPIPTPEELDAWVVLGGLAGERLFHTDLPWNVQNFIKAGSEAVA